MLEFMEEAVDPFAVDTEGFGEYIQRLAVYLYAEDGLVASTQVARLQRAFITLTYLFGHLGLCINVANTVSISCQPCHTLGGHFVEAYGLRIMG